MTAKELYEKYQADLVELQKNCTHPDISDWMEHYWAPAHSSGYQVKVCNVCHATVDKTKSVFSPDSFEMTL